MEESIDQPKPVRVVPIVETTSNQPVTPIHDGVVKPECTFLEYVKNLPESKPTTWSKI